MDSNLETWHLFSLNKVLGIGFGAELQSKFVPKSRVSPVIGYRFTISLSKSYGLYKNSKNNTISCDSVNYINNVLYLGISFNW